MSNPKTADRTVKAGPPPDFLRRGPRFFAFYDFFQISGNARRCVLVKIWVPGGRILAPFCGAGTTVLAAKLEGYEAVGIEVTDAYYKLGSDRVRFALNSRQEIT